MFRRKCKKEDVNFTCEYTQKNWENGKLVNDKTVLFKRYPDDPVKEKKWIKRHFELEEKLKAGKATPEEWLEYKHNHLNPISRFMKDGFGGVEPITDCPDTNSSPTIIDNQPPKSETGRTLEIIGAQGKMLRGVLDNAKRDVDIQSVKAGVGVIRASIDKLGDVVRLGINNKYAKRDAINLIEIIEGQVKDLERDL